MTRTIYPSSISGTIHAAASKSVMQRACALALLHPGTTIISNPGKSNDDQAAMRLIGTLGAVIEKNEAGELVIQSKGFPGNNKVDNSNPITLHCGESGLSVRMFTPIAALGSSAYKLTGEGSLLNRPMNFFESVFPQLGVSISSSHGGLPVHIKGPLVPADISIDASLSSQFLTGLLLAFARSTKEKKIITVSNLVSKPYIDITVQMMHRFGYRITNADYRQFIIEPALPAEPVIRYDVEGDWSGAAFLLVAAAIGGSLIVKGLDIFSPQADRSILSLLMSAGVPISVNEKEIIISPSPTKRVKAFQFDATDCPDLFPPAVALAAYGNGTSVIIGVNRLVHKESNRALSLQQEFAKLGVEIVLQDDLMLITGGPVTGNLVDSQNDHRIAMACAVAALGANGATGIGHTEAVAKSYPGFFDDLKLLGASVSLT